MLPKGFELDWLDPGIAGLVISLNRIPKVYTMTTCEGHVWRDCPGWPTKNGWVHFCSPKTKLIKTIKDFCSEINFFELEDRFVKIDNIRTIYGMFESHEGGDLFRRISPEEQEQYFLRAEKRKEELLRGWGNLNDRIVEYIRKNISSDVESLPFI